MNDLEKRLRFIELRALGKSLDSIGKEIGVSRQTLANWEKEHEEEIQNRRAMELDALEEMYWMKKQGRIELFGESLRRVREELELRDLSEVQTVKLLELELKLVTELKQEFPAPNIMSEREVEQAMLRRLEAAAPYNVDDPDEEPVAPWIEYEENDSD